MSSRLFVLAGGLLAVALVVTHDLAFATAVSDRTISLAQEAVRV